MIQEKVQESSSGWIPLIVLVLALVLDALLIVFGSFSWTDGGRRRLEGGEYGQLPGDSWGSGRAGEHGQSGPADCTN